MELKVGDKVKIRADLEDGEDYGNLFTSGSGGMKEWYGKVLTVSRTREDGRENRFLCEETKSKWTWSHEMVESVVSKGSYTIEEILKNPENFIVTFSNKEDYDNLRCYSEVHLATIWESHRYYLIWKGTQSSDRAYLKETYPNCKFIKFEDIVFPEKKTELKLEKGAYAKYKGTKVSDGLWDHYFGDYGIKTGDVCIIQNCTAGGIYTQQDGRPTTNGRLRASDIELITKEEYDRVIKTQLPLNKNKGADLDIDKPVPKAVYTLEELADKSNRLVCYIETEEQWQRIEDTGICNCTTVFYGAYCYELHNGTYNSASSKTNPGNYMPDATIVTFDQIKFPKKESKAVPKTYKYNKGDIIVCLENIGGWVKEGEICKLGGLFWDIEEVNDRSCLKAKTSENPEGNGCSRPAKFRHASQEEIQYFKKHGFGSNIKVMYSNAFDTVPQNREPGLYVGPVEDPCPIVPTPKMSDIPKIKELESPRVGLLIVKHI